MLFVSGIGNTFPVFFPPLLAEFGGSRAATALAVTLMWTFGAVLAPLAGYLVDRWSPRALIGLAARRRRRRPRGGRAGLDADRLRARTRASAPASASR